MSTTTTPREQAIENYVAYVSDIISQLKSTQDLINGSYEVTPERVNSCLANFFVVNMTVIAEYQRAKLEHLEEERSFEAWWDDRLSEAQDAVIEQYRQDLIDAEKTKTKSTIAKPAVSEYSQRARIDNRSEYEARKRQLDVAEAKMRFLLRVLDSMSEQQRTLTTVASNMRTEMATMNLDRKAVDTSNGVAARRFGRGDR